jgi:hypothetical protein
MFCRSLFVLFLLAIVLSVLLRFTDSDYHFGIFKLSLLSICELISGHKAETYDRLWKESFNSDGQQFHEHQQSEQPPLISKHWTSKKKKKRMILLRWEENFEDTKGVIRIRISKKNRQHNGQKKRYKRTNNDLQNIHIN